ncbi:MAG: response regulator [Verrucomicrobiota bacterium]|nr:response regulator [Verrucomicrobiota bacterium]
MTGQGKRKILLIDDDTSLLVTLSDFLRFEGYEVATADSGEQGVKRLERMAPDLIILDMSMPGMGGVGFLKRISKPDGSLEHPVLVLTARANMAEFFANVSVDGFVAKPCNPADLLMEVGRIIFLRSGAEMPACGSGATARKKVLIGEDNGMVRENLVNAFSDAGFLVDSAASGPEVLEKAIVQKPNAIVVKYVLSEMNGDSVAEMLWKMPNTRRIPIVLYDETNSLAPDFDPARTETTIKKAVYDNNSVSILAAVNEAISA